MQVCDQDHPGLDRQIVHRSAICSGLRELALLGRGVCWLPEQLVRADLDRGTLVLAGASEWTFEVEVLPYLSSRSSSISCERVCATVSSSCLGVKR
ncbi:LysR substrate-binding domain-containing protein [Thalassorhabdomicrobium marinisediminis]|uniref:LysR substrate-binding domain-containing protein n=1 Tax=Thalassorhabdomicrobium marinisediminis TaxID=2170577 RepID=UPI003CD0D441